MGGVMRWVSGNLLAETASLTAWDVPPFGWLQGAVSLMALYVTILILTTQRREDQLAGYREQLTLELAILGEQKSAKIIALLEELRHDSPSVKNRVDHEATAMAIAADPQAVLDAIKDNEEPPDRIETVLAASKVATHPPASATAPAYCCRSAGTTGTPSQPS
jgi:uncharacterized membrane protein